MRIIKHKDSTEEEFSFEFNHFMGMAIWAVYQIMVSILMLNILIAIMNSTYSEVWSSIDEEWRFNRTYYQVQFLCFASLLLSFPQAQFLLPQATFPPPFRWIFYIAKLLYKRKMRESTEEHHVLEMNAVNNCIAKRMNTKHLML